MKCSVLRHPGARPLFALIVGAAIVAASSTVSMTGSAREAFDSRYRCRIIAMLAEIHRNGPVDTSRNRFITLSERASADRYTQCIFIERDTAMYCEASSDAYHTTDRDGVRDVPLPNVIATMHRLGFRQENSRRTSPKELSSGLCRT